MNTEPALQLRGYLRSDPRDQIPSDLAALAATELRRVADSSCVSVDHGFTP